jgi:hypothetical protein
MKHALLLTALLVVCPSHGQDRARHEGYEALDGFVGTWTIPGQESTYQEVCAWYHGERHIICNTESKRKDGSIAHSMSILSFVPDHGYVYTGIGSRGRYETHEKGTFQNGILEYTDHARSEEVICCSLLPVHKCISTGLRSCQLLPNSIKLCL